MQADAGLQQVGDLGQRHATDHRDRINSVCSICGDLVNICTRNHPRDPWGRPGAGVCRPASHCVDDTERFAGHLAIELPAIFTFLWDPSIDATNRRADQANPVRCGHP